MLSILQEAGHSASEQRSGSGSRVAINGDINWNFFVNGQAIGIGAPLSSPNFNVAGYNVAAGSGWRLQRA